LTLQKRAVLEPTARVKAAVVGDSKAGTVWGEVRRSVGLFKSFPLTQMHMQLFNTVNSQKGGFNKVQMAASIVVGYTLLGAAIGQAKNILYGRDPANMDPTTPEGLKFWGNALAQGGGLSLFGDFLFADQNRFGKGMAATALGPVADLVDDIAKFGWGNIQQVLTGQETKFTEESLKLARKYMPFGKFWYWKLAFERTVLDQLDLMLDPKAHGRFQKQENQYWKERKQKSWWKKGDTAPARAPNLEAATGQ
jgi:hypothetical protein